MSYKELIRDIFLGDVEYKSTEEGFLKHILPSLYVPRIKLKNDNRDRNRDILCRYYGINGYNMHTFTEIGRIVDLSRTSIGSICKKGVRICRGPGRVKYIRDNEEFINPYEAKNLLPMEEQTITEFLGISITGNSLSICRRDIRTMGNLLSITPMAMAISGVNRRVIYNIIVKLKERGLRLPEQDVYLKELIKEQRANIRKYKSVIKDLECLRIY